MNKEAFGIAEWLFNSILNDLAEKTISSLPDVETYQNKTIDVPISLSFLFGDKCPNNIRTDYYITFEKAIVNGVVIWKHKI